jgi:hypothetical protein
MVNIFYSPCPDPQNSEKELVYTSSFPHGTTGGDHRLVRNYISQIHISGFQRFYGEVFLTLPSSVSKTLKWSRINGSHS